MKNLRSRIFSCVLLLVYFIDLSAQDPLVHLSFSQGDKDVNKSKTLLSDAVYSVDLLQSQYAPGIVDYALDLSADAMMRRPLIVDSLSLLHFHLSESFSIQIFVKTKVGAQLGTAIAGNKNHDSIAAPGWQIISQPNGAWGVNLSDGQQVYNYLATQRQIINDGHWHQLVLSVERPKNEARMYFDGLLVAIYNLESLGDLGGALRTVIGGSDQYFEWGSAGQWKAFNGYVDEVKLWNRTISYEEVQNNWQAFFPAESSVERMPPNQVKIMTWNIWHGGRRYGQHVGVERTIEIIKNSQVDIICMIETYGSGAIIADALGYYFYLISSNLSIISKYPITRTIEAFRAFNFGGAVIELAPGKEILVYDTWLHYLPDYLKSISEKKSSTEALIAAERETRATEIDEILKQIETSLVDDQYSGVVMAGDFNSGSHLDWIERTKDIHHQYVVNWPVSTSMMNAGFKDSFRELHLDPLTDPGFTWTPRAATSSDKYGPRDRIDYIYYQGDLKPIFSEVIDRHPIMFPSDHAAVVTIFEFE